MSAEKADVTTEPPLCCVPGRLLQSDEFAYMEEVIALIGFITACCFTITASIYFILHLISAIL